MSLRPFDAAIVGFEPYTVGTTLVTFTCPVDVATAARAGQAALILCRDRYSRDPWLRQSFPLCNASVDDGTLAILSHGVDSGARWLSERRAGDRLDVIGPIGDGFSVAPNARNLLLVGERQPVSALMMLAIAESQAGRNVTLMLGADTEKALPPPGYLPNTVELIVATEDGSRGQIGSIADVVPDYARWADQIFVTGRDRFIREVRGAVQPHRIAGKPSVQVAVQRSMPCGAGVCNGCPVATKRGTMLACVDGPVFDLDLLV